MIESTSNKLVFTIASSAEVNFNIRFFEPSEIYCYLEKNDGSGSVELVRNTDFSVEAKSDYSEGAKITLLVGSENVPTLPTGRKLAVLRKLPVTQMLNLPELGKLPSTPLETELDRIIMLIQQLLEWLGRCLASDPIGNSSPVIDLSEYAKLLSPHLIGIPTAPTAPPGTNTTQIATCEFVMNEISRASGTIGGYATAAQNSATSAGNSATNAANSATNAANSATSAAYSATSAGNSARDAAISAGGSWIGFTESFSIDFDAYRGYPKHLADEGRINFSGPPTEIGSFGNQYQWTAEGFTFDAFDSEGIRSTASSGRAILSVQLYEDGTAIYNLDVHGYIGETVENAIAGENLIYPSTGKWRTVGDSKQFFIPNQNNDGNPGFVILVSR